MEIDSYLSYQISLALWVYGIDVTSFSVVISSHVMSQLMSEGVVTNGTALEAEGGTFVFPNEIGHTRVS